MVGSQAQLLYCSVLVVPIFGLVKVLLGFVAHERVRQVSGFVIQVVESAAGIAHVVTSVRLIQLNLPVCIVDSKVVWDLDWAANDGASLLLDLS